MGQLQKVSKSPYPEPTIESTVPAVASLVFPLKL
jgi:hypothetical protein